MQAVILAAGEGTRLRPLSYTRPKHMLPVANKPLLEHALLAFRDAGIKDFVLVVRYKKEKIMDYFGDGKRFGVKIRYCEQPDEVGTGAAFMAAKAAVDGSFVGAVGDTIFPPEDIRRLVKSHNGGVTALAKRVEHPERYGVFVTNGDKITKVIEKPENPVSNLTNVGLYVFDPEVFDFISKSGKSPRGEREVTDAIQMFADKGMAKAVEMKCGWFDLGSPWQLLEINHVLLDEIGRKVEGKVEKGATIRGKVQIGKGTIVYAGAFIEGPCVIGKNCKIGPNCYIHNHVSIGDGCCVGNAVEIKESIIMPYTNVKHLSYVGDSIIGERCNFGAGTITANLRHDKASIKIFSKGNLVDSGRKKFGTIVGDHTKTGIHTSICCGKTLGPFSWTDSASYVKADLPPGHILLSDGRVEPVELLKQQFEAGIKQT